jgi:hypothetical protein
MVFFCPLTLLFVGLVIRSDFDKNTAEPSWLLFLSDTLLPVNVHWAALLEMNGVALISNMMK